jgi:hypothetical protein
VETSEGDDTDEAEAAGGTVRRYPRSAALRDGSRRNDGNDTLGGSGRWFKLRWWKKGRRWRWDGQDEGNGGSA